MVSPRKFVAASAGLMLLLCKGCCRRSGASGSLGSHRGRSSDTSEGAIMTARTTDDQVRRSRPRTSRIALALALVAAVAITARPFATGARRWPVIGRDARNSRNQPREHKIRPANADRLALKWVATVAGDVSAT